MEFFPLKGDFTRWIRRFEIDGSLCSDSTIFLAQPTSSMILRIDKPRAGTGSMHIAQEPTGPFRMGYFSTSVEGYLGGRHS